MVHIDYAKGNAAAEAVCSALFQTAFELIGESAGGRETWWFRGSANGNVKVAVIRPVERNELMTVIFFAAVHPLMGRSLARKEFTIILDSSNEDLAPAVEKVVQECLLVYRNVLAGIPVR